MNTGCKSNREKVAGNRNECFPLSTFSFPQSNQNSRPIWREASDNLMSLHEKLVRASSSPDGAYLSQVGTPNVPSRTGLAPVPPPRRGAALRNQIDGRVSQKMGKKRPVVRSDSEARRSVCPTDHPWTTGLTPSMENVQGKGVGGRKIVETRRRKATNTL